MTHQHQEESKTQEGHHDSKHKKSTAKHADHHAQHHNATHHDSHELSRHDRVLLKLRELVEPILPSHGHGHGHHHHHHKHVEYKAPEKLTPKLALYSIKKLSILDHTIPAKDIRLINPVKPGVISWLSIMGMTFIGATWGAFIIRTSGVRGFYGKGGLVLLGIVAVSVTMTRIIDEAREMTVYWQRKKLAQQYRDKYGDKYLLKVLDPSFQLEHHH